MRECDVGLIVPLREEFKVLQGIFPVIDSEKHDAMHYHTLEVPDSRCRVIAVVLGDMGRTLASHVTAEMLAHFKPKVIVLLGLAGALDKDIKLGDVVVADEINEYQAASKAVGKDRLQYSGQRWQIGFALKQCVGNFEISNRDLCDAWRDQVRDFRAGLGLGAEQLALVDDLPEIKIGHVASGDVVIASADYAADLLRIDRKLLAVEMEAAGVAQVAHGRREPIQIMVVRGISDFADERKNELDAVNRGAWRKYAVYSAGAFLLHLLKSEDFQGIIFQRPLSASWLSAYLDALTRQPDYARWTDRPRVHQVGEDHYIQTESKILPLFASPYEDDTGRQRKDLLKTIRSQNRLLILGEPGVGKTAALERMVWETANAGGPIVPIYMPLSDYDGHLLTEVQEALAETGALPFSKDDEVRDFLRQNQCLVLLDGLNEVRRDQRQRIVGDIASFLQTYRRHRYVVTSRSQDPLWHELRDERVVPVTVVVQPVADAQVREYLVAHLGEREGRGTFDGLNECLRGMARTPLFLWMLKEVRQAGRQVPGNRGELFDRFVEMVFTRDETKLEVAAPRPAKKKALARLAFRLQEEHRLACQEREAVAIVSEAEGEYDAQALIGEALVHGLLKGRRQLRFMHQAVQEYFVALALDEMVAIEVGAPDWQQLGKRVLRRGLTAWAGDDWWAECFVQLAGLTDNPSWLVQMVAKVNPWLAFWCMVEGQPVDDETQRLVEANTVDLLRSNDVRKRQRAVKELGRLKNPRTAGDLADVLGDEVEEVVNLAVQGLGRLGELAVPRLLPRLESNDVAVRRAATRALGQAWQFAELEDLGGVEASARLAALDRLAQRRDTRAVEAVVAAARWDPELAVRQRAVEALAQLGDTRAVGPLLTVLEDGTPSLRAGVAAALGRLGDERAVEPLTEALKDDDETVRRSAIGALGRIWELPDLFRLGDHSVVARVRAATALGRQGDVRAVPSLIAALRDKDEAVCANAATALGQLGSAQAVEPLVSLLLTRKEEPAARMRAAEALGRLGDRRAVGPLIAALRDAEQNVRWSAVQALGQLRDEQAIEPLLALCEDQDMQERAVAALGQIGRPAALALIAALREGRRQVRIGAARALGQIGGAHALEALLVCLRDDKDRIVRAGAAMALGQIGGAEATDALVDVLEEDRDKIVRARAAISLGQIGGERAVKALTETLKDRYEDEAVWRMAIGALGRIWRLPPLVRLGHKDATIRRDAAVALGQLRDEQALEPLKAALRDRNEGVRHRAISALGRIWGLSQLVRLGDDWATERKEAAAALGQLGDARAVEPLIAALRDGDAAVRLAATEALGQLEDEQAVQPLIAALGDDDRQVQRGASEALKRLAPWAIPGLISALRGSNYWFRRRKAAETLAQIGDLDSLIEALRHDDRFVRRSAADALVQLESTQSVRPLIAALEDEDHYVRRRAAEALGEIEDPRAVKPLSHILQRDRDWLVRQAAAEAIGDIGTQSAVDALITALGDDEWPVRWMAAKALGKIRHPSAVMPLIDALKGDWPALWTVAEALGQLEDPRAVGSLVEALHHREGDKYVQQAAVEALGKIGEPIQNPLIDVLREGDEAARQKATMALGQMRDARDLDPLIGALKDTESYQVHQGAMEALVQLGEAAVEPLIAVLQERDSRFEFRRRAAQALGQIEDARVVQPLIAALRGDSVQAVRQAAADALRTIGAPEALEAVRMYGGRSRGAVNV